LALGTHAAAAVGRVGSTVSTAGLANPIYAAAESFTSVVATVLAIALPVCCLILALPMTVVLVLIVLRRRKAKRAAAEAAAAAAATSLTKSPPASTPPSR